jgi:hypothetical protein
VTADIRNQSEETGALNGRCELELVTGASVNEPRGTDLPVIGGEQDDGEREDF